MTNRRARKRRGDNSTLVINLDNQPGGAGRAQPEIFDLTMRLALRVSRIAIGLGGNFDLKQSALSEVAKGS